MAEPITSLISGFKGLNNRLDPTALGPEWQLQANNVLCDDAHYLVLRPGSFEFFLNVVDAFGTRDERMFVVTSSGALYEVYSDASYRQRATGFSGAPFQWAEMGYATFAMSETAAWAIYPDRVVGWGIPALNAPTLSITNGTLPAGSYFVATILEAPDGRIGGCTGTASVILPNVGGISVAYPAVAGYETRVYLSETNGVDLFHAGYLAAGTITIANLPTTKGHRLDTLHFYPPPLGGIVSSHGNRMLVAVWEPGLDRSVLYWSKEDAPHWFCIETDYQIVAGRPTLLASVSSGVLIGTDRALYAVDSSGIAQRIAGFGALIDTLHYLDTDQVVFWTDRGLCRYPPLELLSDAALIPDNRTLSTGAILKYTGSTYFLTAMRGAHQIRPINPYIPLSVTVT